jgi:hypothetical protein
MYVHDHDSECCELTFTALLRWCACCTIHACASHTQQRTNTSVLSAQSSMSSSTNNAAISSNTAANSSTAVSSSGSSSSSSNKLQDIQACARLWRLLQECYTNTGGKQHADMYATKATAAEGEFQVRICEI